MMNSNVITAEAKEVVFSLENLGYDQSLAERIVSHVESEDFDVLLDACGRLKAYVEAAPNEVQRIHHLLHSQNVRNNYGAFKQLGFDKVPDALLKVCRYMSVTLKPYLPKEKPEEQIATAVEKCKEIISVPGVKEVISEAAETPLTVNEETASTAEEFSEKIPNNDEEQPNTDSSDDAYAEILEFIYNKLAVDTKKKLMRKLFNELTG